MPKVSLTELVESKTDKDKAKEPKIEGTKMLEILSPSAEVTVPKGLKFLTFLFLQFLALRLYLYQS